MLDSQLCGLKPWGHHLTRLLFHTANTLAEGRLELHRAGQPFHLTLPPPNE
jgi:hypothetical protein